MGEAREPEQSWARAIAQWIAVIAIVLATYHVLSSPQIDVRCSTFKEFAYGLSGKRYYCLL